MAVKEANSNYKSFTFNGVSAADYGVYVTDVNVFNSAEREVEYITIPGRNGSFALDHGRFENIIVEYECALGQDTDVDFATAISDFRNALAAAKGYQRLEDEMNPDEYRMAVFSKGLDAPTLNQQTATFKVEFNCKPQRYLKSGETAVAVSSGGTISNPTLYDASPLLQVWGYGGLAVNGEPLAINSVPVGNIQISGLQKTDTRGTQASITLNLNALNTGDAFWLEYPTAQVHFGGSAIEAQMPHNATVTSLSENWMVAQTSWDGAFGSPTLYIKVANTGGRVYELYKGDTDTGFRGRFQVSVGTLSFTYGVDIVYDGGSTITYSIQVNAQNVSVALFIPSFNSAYGVSSKSALGEPLYFDLDIGEAYKVEDGQIISTNSAVTIPAKLPVLKPGANTITYDNTITQFKIVPRWWKV